jgi:hypothetical protein
MTSWAIFIGGYPEDGGDIFLRILGRYNAEDHTLHSRRCKNLRSSNEDIKHILVTGYISNQDEALIYCCIYSLHLIYLYWTKGASCQLYIVHQPPQVVPTNDLLNKKLIEYV